MVPRPLLRVSLVACALALVMGVRSAHAQVETAPDLEEAAAPRPAPATARTPHATSLALAPPTESYWYGWQTATSDAASIAVILAGSAMHAPLLSYAGAGGVLFGAPAVHIANGRAGVGFGSLGLRVVLPVMGAVIGYSAAGSCQEDPRSTQLLGNCFLHGIGEAALGGLIGVGSAMVIDATALTFGRREISEPRESGMPRVTSVAPSYDPLTRTASVGMGGRF